MKKFSYKTLRKYVIPSFVLGAILLFGLVSPSFTNASIIVTGPTTTTQPPCHYPDCHYPTTTTTQPPCTTTTTCSPTTTTTICHSPSVNISAAPISIPYNDSAALHWTSSNTNYCTASASPYNYQWNGNVSLNGDKTIYNLTKTTTFTITCNSNCHYDTITDSATVYVQAPPPPTRYACNTSTWQCVVNSSGPYTSLSTCQANCQAPVPQFNFSLTNSGNIVVTKPSYGSISGSNVITANLISGTTQSVSFSQSGLPYGVSASYLGSCYPTCSRSNTLTVNSSASVGTFPITVTATGGGITRTTTYTLIVNETPTTAPTLNLSADKYTINQGESTYLRWTSTNANYCTASNGWSGSKSTSGYESVSPSSNTTYGLTCYGSGGQVSRFVTIDVVEPTPTRYSCNTNTYQCYVATNGAYANLNDCVNACQTPTTRYACNTSTWQCYQSTSGPYTSLNNCQNNCIAQTRYSCNYSTHQCYQTTSGSYISYNDCANACQQTNQSLSVSCSASPNPAQTDQTVTFSSNISGGSGNYSYYWSGATYGNSSYSQKSFSSYGNYTAYLTVHDSQNRSASTSCSVNVSGQYTNTPTLNLWADKYTIAQGESTYLRWTSTNANYCTASNGWSGSKSTSGYESVSPSPNTTYGLTCYGSGGQITRSVTIYVTSVSTNLNLTKLGRNLSSGDRVYAKIIRVTEGDVIEFYLTITAGNNKDLYNANIKDIMPSVLSYMPGTTKINGMVQSDTIATTGLSLGTIYRGASKTIVFQAISLSPGTYLTYTNTAEVTADNETKITDSASVTYGLVAGAATIRTGPLNTLLISLVISLISSLMIWYYLKFNPKGQLAFVRTESKIRDMWLAYTRRRIMRGN